MSSSILESIREYLIGCPLLDAEVLRINYLGAKPMEYTLEDVPSEATIKTYINGDTVRQALFLFASRELYARSAIENLKACGFYERLAHWLDINSAANNLPKLPEGLYARKIEAVSNGYCMSADIEQNTQQYQIQCKLTYFKEAN